jgi:hypothetical protein
MVEGALRQIAAESRMNSKRLRNFGVQIERIPRGEQCDRSLSSRKLTYLPASHRAGFGGEEPSAKQQSGTACGGWGSAPHRPGDRRPGLAVDAAHAEVFDFEEFLDAVF